MPSSAGALTVSQNSLRLQGVTMYHNPCRLVSLELGRLSYPFIRPKQIHHRSRHLEEIFPISLARILSLLHSPLTSHLAAHPIHVCRPRTLPQVWAAPPQIHSLGQMGSNSSSCKPSLVVLRRENPALLTLTCHLQTTLLQMTHSWHFCPAWVLKGAWVGEGRHYLSPERNRNRRH
jgi:hypothetical protein